MLHEVIHCESTNHLFIIQKSWVSVKHIGKKNTLRFAVYNAVINPVINAIITVVSQVQKETGDCKFVSIGD